ncbi:MAG: serine/threonine-protein kinase [Pirellulales bacterium]
MKTLIPMNVSTPESDSADRPEPTQRFTYASGSRPLDGYTIKRGVGRGGFGEVYFALSDAGKEVALKLIRRNLDVELRGVTHCLNLKHPNLVSLYDIRNDVHDDRWVVMEFVSGQSLDQVIAQYPDGMPIDLVLHWFHGISAGVGYLHDHGIVHRDMKPANLFMDQWAGLSRAGLGNAGLGTGDEGEGVARGGTVKIGDYGLSKFISCSRRSGQTESVGTVHYMAPEIANGRYGREIDIYALGIILYEMLTGHVPFEGESVGEVLMKHLTAEPDLSPLAEPYKTIVRRAMAKDPDQRISNVAEIRQLLPAAPQMPPITAGPSLSPWPSLSAGHAPDKDRFSNDQANGTKGLHSPPMTDEEPILANLRTLWRQAEERYHNNTTHPFFKVGLTLLLLSGLVFSAEIWLPMLMTAAFLYLMYRAVRAVIVQPTNATAQPPATRHCPNVGGPVAADKREVQPAKASDDAKPVEVPRKNSRPWKRRRHVWRKQMAKQIAAKPFLERLTELCGSMLTAAVIASVLAIFTGYLIQPPLNLTMTLWITLVVTLGSWAVLIPAKLTEGRLEDQAPRRFAQLVLGALVGVAAWGLADLLLLTVPLSDQAGVGLGDAIFNDLLGLKEHQLLGNVGSASDARMNLPVYAGYFGLLFVILAWWRQAEFLRSVRVNLWSVFWCAAVAWGLHFLWWFPQPLGWLLAASIAFTIQLSSPWLPASRRQELMNQDYV